MNTTPQQHNAPTVTLTAHVPRALTQEVEQITGTIPGTPFYRQDGDQYEALILCDDGYIVAIALDEVGNIHTSSREDGGEWEGGVNI